MKGRDDVGRTEAQKRAGKKTRQKIYELISFDSRREARLLDLIHFAASKKNVSKATYISDAIQSQLSRDGITIDMLPADAKYTPPAPEPKQPRRYMIYMIIERFILDDDDDPGKYIAMFPTLKAAEKYARGKFDRKAYPIDWTYTILGRYIEGENQRDAFGKLKVLVKDELETDRDGTCDDGSNYLERIENVYPVEYTQEIKYEGENTESSLDDNEYIFEFEEDDNKSDSHGDNSDDDSDDNSDDDKFDLIDLVRKYNFDESEDE